MRRPIAKQSAVRTLDNLRLPTKLSPEGRASPVLRAVPPNAGRRSRSASLFDRDRLREIARLIDVQPTEPRDPVGEQLQRQHREDGL